MLVYGAETASCGVSADMLHSNIVSIITTYADNHIAHTSKDYIYRSRTA